MATAAAVVALTLGGQGLLVPAGPRSTLVRAAGALTALAAVSVLLRLDGPARGTRTLTLVAVAGALTALATLPVSPVTLDEARPAPSAEPGARPSEDAGGTVVLDQVRPDEAPGADGTLVLPPGATLELEGGDVLLRLPDGSASVLGRAGAEGAQGSPAPPAGQRVEVVPPGAGGAVVTRTDGGAIGAGTALGGMSFERGDGSRVVVGDGVLLDVPDPLPVEPDVEEGLDEGVEAVLALLLGAFTLLAFAPPVVRFAERMSGPAAEPAPVPAPSRTPATTVEAGLADVLRAMLADPDPRTAVIGAYARLLSALDEVGYPRRAEEGPHEHLWRILGPLGVRRAPVHRLAELFVRARFTPRPITEAHRQAAIGALADAVADLRLQAGDVDELAGARA